MKPDERAALSDDADTEYQLTDRALISMVRGAAAEGICGRLHENHFVRLCDIADECERLRELMRQRPDHERVGALLGHVGHEMQEQKERGLAGVTLTRVAAAELTSTIDALWRECERLREVAEAAKECHWSPPDGSDVDCRLCAALARLEKGAGE
jgi:hypothetical protein